MHLFEMHLFEMHFKMHLNNSFLNSFLKCLRKKLHMPILILELFFTVLSQLLFFERFSNVLKIVFSKLASNCSCLSLDF
jgi:hypothetical protein